MKTREKRSMFIGFTDKCIDVLFEWEPNADTN